MLVVKHFELLYSFSMFLNVRYYMIKSTYVSVQTYFGKLYSFNGMWLWAIIKYMFANNDHRSKIFKLDNYKIGKSAVDYY